MTDIVYSRCKDCNPNSVKFQCWTCKGKDDTVRKQMRQEKKEMLQLSQYKLNYNFPPMPPPSQLVVNDQILVAGPAKRPRDEDTDVPVATPDEFALDYSPPPKVTPKKPAVKAAPLPPAAVDSPPPKKVVQVAVTPKKPAVKAAPLPPAVVDSPPPKKVVQVAVTPKKPAVKAAPLPQAAVDSPPPKKVVQVAVTPKKPAVKAAPLPQDSSSSETCSNSESEQEGWEDEEQADDDSSTAVVAVSKDGKTPKMAKITVKERECVMEWLAKPRRDNKMNNARWIRNGGGQGQSMTATSGEVRTSGAYEALAA
jgi:hypothetical protein